MSHCYDVSMVRTESQNFPDIFRGDQIEEHFNDTDEDKPSYFFWYQKYRKGKTEEDLRKFDIVIAPYGPLLARETTTHNLGTLRSDHDKNQVLMYTQWNRVVLDEGHLIRNKDEKWETSLTFPDRRARGKFVWNYMRHTNGFSAELRYRIVSRICTINCSSSELVIHRYIM